MEFASPCLPWCAPLSWTSGSAKRGEDDRRERVACDDLEADGVWQFLREGGRYQACHLSRCDRVLTAQVAEEHLIEH